MIAALNRKSPGSFCTKIRIPLCHGLIDCQVCLIVDPEQGHAAVECLVIESRRHTVAGWRNARQVTAAVKLRLDKIIPPAERKGAVGPFLQLPGRAELGTIISGIGLQIDDLSELIVDARSAREAACVESLTADKPRILLEDKVPEAV